MKGGLGIQVNNKFMSRFFLIIVVIVLAASCKSARKIQAPPVTIIVDTVVKSPEVTSVPKEDTAAIIKSYYELIQKNRINVTTFSAKIDINYRDNNGKKIDANANVRMYTDSVIWISLTGPLGIEGARVYITEDTVKILDKQEKIITVRSVAYLQEIINLPLNLRSLQDLLLGNPVFFDEDIVSFSRSASTISFKNHGEFFINLLTIQDDNKQIINSRLDELDENQNRNSILNYAEYENKKGPLFSTRREILVTDTKKIDIELDFKQYSFNETLSFPFNVPKNYKHN